MEHPLPEILTWLKPVAAVVLLALFWSWESIAPYFVGRRGRLRHAGHNLALALGNTIALALVFASAIVAVAQATASQQFGLLNQVELPAPVRWLLALLLLDGWMYCWHRLNHVVPFLWRFHRTHHADAEMDVTTATRFHPGEHLGAVFARLALIPVLGLTLEQLLLYDAIVLAVTLFHHANISLGRWNCRLAWVIVTPEMHRVHHSREMVETNSNYSTVLSLWDRLAGSFRWRSDPRGVRLGLDGFDDPAFQTVSGMLRTPTLPLEPIAAAPRQSRSHRGKGPTAGAGWRPSETASGTARIRA